MIGLLADIRGEAKREEGHFIVGYQSEQDLCSLRGRDN